MSQKCDRCHLKLAVKRQITQKFNGQLAQKRMRKYEDIIDR